MDFSELYLTYYSKLVRFAKRICNTGRGCRKHNTRCVYRLMGENVILWIALKI